MAFVCIRTSISGKFGSRLTDYVRCGARKLAHCISLTLCSVHILFHVFMYYFDYICFYEMHERHITIMLCDCVHCAYMQLPYMSNEQSACCGNWTCLHCKKIHLALLLKCNPFGVGARMNPNNIQWTICSWLTLMCTTVLIKQKQQTK